MARMRHGDCRSSQVPRFLSLTDHPGAAAPARIVADGALAGGSAILACRSLRKVADSQPPNPAGVGLDDLEYDARRMGDGLSARRNMAGQGEYEATQRVDVLFAFLLRQHRPDAALELFDRRTGIGDQAAVRPRQHLRTLFHIVLVFDLADDFLDDVLDGRETVDAAELVDHQR